MVKPKTCIRKTAPTSETGIATTGMSTERSEPRKRKITTMTMRSVSDQRLQDFVDRVLDVFGRVVGDAAFMPGRQFAWMSAISVRTRLMTSSELALGRTQMPMNTACLPREADFGVVVLGAQHHVGDVAQAHERAVLLAHDELPELLGGVQVGVAP